MKALTPERETQETCTNRKAIVLLVDRKVLLVSSRAKEVELFTCRKESSIRLFNARKSDLLAPLLTVKASLFAKHQPVLTRSYSTRSVKELRGER